MAQSPKTRSIPLEEFENLPADVQPAFEKLIGMLNGFFTDSGNAFDALLGKNAQAQFEEGVKLKTDGSSVPATVTFKNRLSFKPRAVSTVALKPADNTVALDYSIVNPIWTLTSKGEIRIDYLGGLAASTSYVATFKVE